MLAVGLTAITGVFAEAEKPILYGDGKHDDHEALQAWADDIEVVSGGYMKVSKRVLIDGDFRLSRPVYLRNGEYDFTNCQIHGADMIILARGTHVILRGSLSHDRFIPKTTPEWIFQTTRL